MNSPKSISYHRVTEDAFLMQIFVKKFKMKMLYTLLVIGIATILLITANGLTDRFAFQIHPNSFVNGLVKYQMIAVAVGTLVALSIWVLAPDSRQFLNTGQLNAIAQKEKWLGINGQSSWLVNGLQLLLVVSIVTGIVMFLAVKHSNSMGNFQWQFVPFILLCSFTNSLAEELIYRFGIVGGLFNHYPKLIICIVSAILFGLPHFFGWPSGIAGILMSGVLGYILCKATVETTGLSIAWTIHFVQDIIIFTALFMVNVKL